MATQTMFPEMSLQVAKNRWTQCASTLCSQYQVATHDPALLKKAIEAKIERIRQADQNQLISNTISLLKQIGEDWTMCNVLVKAHEEQQQELLNQFNDWFAEYDAVQGK
jgi:hypothetical protein